MTAVIFLILRVLLTLVLYSFLGWGIWTIWQDLQSQAKLQTRKKIPSIWLIDESGAEASETCFSQALVTIGRAQANDFPVENDTVSNRHARLNYHHEQWWVEDLSSTNGTTLNEQEIDTTTVLRSGDMIGCGETRYLVRIDEDG